MVPDPTRTALGLEYFLWERDAEWSWPDERLIDHGIRDCTQIGLIDAAEVEDAAVIRVPKAYPVYDQHYHDHLTTVRRYLASLANLQLIGRNGQHRYNNQDHSMLAGVYAARNLNGAHLDVWSVNTEAAYHEEVSTPSSVASERLVPSPLHAPGAAVLSAERVIERAFARLDPVALGAAFAVVAGVGLFLATAVLLLNGATRLEEVALLGQYFLGFSVTWKGAVIGLLEAAAGGFALGYATARLRNHALAAYATRLRRRLAAEVEGRVLDEV